MCHKCPLNNFRTHNRSGDTLLRCHGKAGTPPKTQIIYKNVINVFASSEM